MDESLEVKQSSLNKEQKDDSNEIQGVNELEVFREEWREELRRKNQPKQKPPSTSIEEEVSADWAVLSILLSLSGNFYVLDGRSG